MFYLFISFCHWSWINWLATKLWKKQRKLVISLAIGVIGLCSWKIKQHKINENSSMNILYLHFKGHSPFSTFQVELQKSCDWDSCPRHQLSLEYSCCCQSTANHYNASFFFPFWHNLGIIIHALDFENISTIFPVVIYCDHCSSPYQTILFIYIFHPASPGRVANGVNRPFFSQCKEAGPSWAKSL